jgi:hypothetical protein
MVFKPKLNRLPTLEKFNENFLLISYLHHSDSTNFSIIHYYAETYNFEDSRVAEDYIFNVMENSRFIKFNYLDKEYPPR